MVPVPRSLITVPGIFAALAWWFRVPVSNYVNDWRANRKSLEAIYARQVMNACRTNDAPNAYVAMLSWRRETSSLSATSAINTPPLDPANATLELEWAELEQNLFGQNPPIEQWSGKRLGEAFERSRKKRKQQVQGETNAFPPLNPENV